MSMDTLRIMQCALQHAAGGHLVVVLASGFEPARRLVSHYCLWDYEVAGHTLYLPDGGRITVATPECARPEAAFKLMPVALNSDVDTQHTASWHSKASEIVR